MLAVHPSRVVLSIALVAGLASCAADFTITLRNRSTLAFVPYPVVTDPPPPHREADPANTLGNNAEVSIDPVGFNPLFYNEGTQIGLMLQLALDDDPPAVLVRIFQHSVAPGQEGSDPSAQPQLVDEVLFEPTAENLIFTVRPQGSGFPVEFEEN